MLIRASDPSPGHFLGIVSDRRLVTWVRRICTAAAFLATPLQSLSLPSLHIYTAVVTTTRTATLLTPNSLMRRMALNTEELFAAVTTAV
jgi:hypothetical protein